MEKVKTIGVKEECMVFTISDYFNARFDCKNPIVVKEMIVVPKYKGQGYLGRFSRENKALRKSKTPR